MDYGYKFENLINEIISKPDYITYANNWSDKNERTALLYTACLIKYDKNGTGAIGEKLEYYMNELFEENDEEKNISIECVKFLESLK
tara:strand:+ start:8719 stop:8979 length:261 start_codon:yes stop_codon:yes gene_type:complete